MFEEVQKVLLFFSFALWQVLNIEELMKPKLEEEREKVVDAAREEALENAIALVKQRLKEQMELEQQAKEDTGKE